MKILVLGASQGTGALAVKVALERGHKVTAFARHPDKLVLEHADLSRVSGDFHNQESVAKVMPGHEAVIITASSTTLKGFRDNPTYFSQGTAHAIAAMKANAIKRLVVLAPWAWAKVASWPTSSSTSWSSDFCSRRPSSTMNAKRSWSWKVASIGSSPAPPA